MWYIQLTRWSLSRYIATLVSKSKAGIVHLIQYYIPQDEQSKWFEPGRIVTCLRKLIVQVSVVLRKTVGWSDWHFDSLSGGHLQSQKDSEDDRLRMNNCTQQLHCVIVLGSKLIKLIKGLGSSRWWVKSSGISQSKILKHSLAPYLVNCWFICQQYLERLCCIHGRMLTGLQSKVIF